MPEHQTHQGCMLHPLPNHPHFNKELHHEKIIAVALLPLFLAACGKSLDGTYQDSTGMASLTFKGDTVDYMGMFDLDYTVEDGKVKIEGMNGETALVLKIKDDNTLVMPMVGELKKR
ncbi:hypothetical protein B5M06_10950 [Comamonas kerstersii]|uniref:Uncharacterized protein n=1 Tax=Comamonas kerstersii TaxID=225992 RepID=A0A1V0BFJ8_9BURK|nr:hypothetical protein [Comamonas kerstersii]AQZ98690.1 hypothetical protein B5M06_10950 [Comamonas kerstersii]